MANKQISYDATIQKFFDSALKHLDNRIKKAKDINEVSHILVSRNNLQKIADNPRKYLNKTYDYVNQNLSTGFIRGENNSVWLAVSQMLKAITEYYYRVDNGWYAETAQSDLLKANAQCQYKFSTSILKDFYYPLAPNKAFAVYVENNKHTK